MHIDESLFELKTPWAACAALEKFFSNGGSCKANSNVNWLGILSGCNLRMTKDASNSTEDLTPPSLDEAFAWGHLQIAICDSLSAAGDDQGGTPSFVSPDVRSMWVRAVMIERCGDIPGDAMCDLTRLVKWCFANPDVHEFLKSKEHIPIYAIPTGVRLRAELLEFLVNARKLQATGDVECVLRKARFP